MGWVAPPGLRAVPPIGRMLDRCGCCLVYSSKSASFFLICSSNAVTCSVSRIRSVNSHMEATAKTRMRSVRTGVAMPEVYGLVYFLACFFDPIPNSAAVHGLVRSLWSERRRFTCSTLTGEAVCSHSRRM
jgi:hypothetical protein